MKLKLVPARTGIEWVKLGIRTFFRQPLALVSLFFMYMGVMLVLAQIPVIGVIIGGMLVPAATLGLMAATAEADKGAFPMPTVLFSAFRAGRQRARAMLILGALYAGLSILATAIAALVAGGAGAMTAADGAGAMQLDVATLVALLLHAPLFLLFWFAPALVHWHGVSPAKSLFFSAVACLKNFAALSVYSLVWFVLFVLLGLALTMVGVALGGPGVTRIVLMPLLLAMGAMFSTSFYYTFRDSFEASSEDPSQASPEPPTT
jgi:hypothetical protein